MSSPSFNSPMHREESAVPSISVVIPVLDEEARIGTCVRCVRALAGFSEIIVVDGGSSDRTVEIAKRVNGISVRRATRGRAAQMNVGAAMARGEALLFLHADTRLPADADRLVEAALAGNVHWGRFDVAIEGRHPLLPLIARLMNLRSRLTGIATGDQAMFVRRGAFAACGGFPPVALMEDIAFARALKRLGRPACLRARVRTSGRRWERHGVLRTVLLMWRLRLAYFLGADPSRLAHQYGYDASD